MNILEQLFCTDDGMFGTLDVDGFVYFVTSPMQLVGGDHTFESGLVDSTVELRLGYRLGVVDNDGKKVIELLQQQQATKRFRDTASDRMTITVV